MDYLLTRKIIDEDILFLNEKINHLSSKNFNLWKTSLIVSWPFAKIPPKIPNQITTKESYSMDEPCCIFIY